MCDVEKRGSRFVSRFQPNPIRSEEKGAHTHSLSPAKGYRVRDRRALPRLNAYALLAAKPASARDPIQSRHEAEELRNFTLGPGPLLEQG
jgi:hypothetical protein